MPTAEERTLGPGAGADETTQRWECSVTHGCPPGGPWPLRAGGRSWGNLAQKWTPPWTGPDQTLPWTEPAEDWTGPCPEPDQTLPGTGPCQGLDPVLDQTLP